MGAAVGAAIAVWGTKALRAVPFSMAWPIKFQTRVDGTALAFAMLLGIACGLAFGLAPAVQLARVDPQQALRAGARGSGGRSRIRNILMGTEVALALAVLIVAAIFFRSVHDTRETDTGFRREGVLVAAYDLSGRGLDEAGTRAFATRLLAGLRALPGVEAAAIARSVPLDIHGMPLRAFTLEGRARTDGVADQALVNTVTPGYFRTMGIALLEGADFTDLADAAAPPQAIVSCSANAKIVETQVVRNPFAVGWRVILKFEPAGENKEPVDLRCTLNQNEASVSETWCYLWSPP